MALVKRVSLRTVVQGVKLELTIVQGVKLELEMRGSKRFMSNDFNASGFVW
jgi:hypothetical protein